jgi:hypothetical protein
MIVIPNAAIIVGVLLFLAIVAANTDWPDHSPKPVIQPSRNVIRESAETIAFYRVLRQIGIEDFDDNDVRAFEDAMEIFRFHDCKF